MVAFLGYTSGTDEAPPTTITFNKPSEAVEGGRLFFYLGINFGQYTANKDPGDITLPSGVTLVGQSADLDSDSGVMVYTKVVGSSEPSTYDFVMTSAYINMWACIATSAGTVGSFVHGTGYGDTWATPGGAEVENDDALRISVVRGRATIGGGDHTTARFTQVAVGVTETLGFSTDAPGVRASTDAVIGECNQHYWWASELIVEGTAGGTEDAPPDAFPLRAGYWTEITPSAWIDGNFTQGVAFAPSNRNRLYLCITDFDNEDQCGLWRSSDGGETWTQVSDGTYGPDAPINVCVDPDDEDHIYVSSGVRGGDQGFWRSDDGGDTWEMPSGFASVAPNLDVYHVAVDPTDFDHVLTSFHTSWTGYSASGVLRSTNGGTSWTLIAPPGGAFSASGCCIDFLYHPASSTGNAATWIFSAQDGGGRWRTTNSGSSWTQVSTNSMTHGGQQVVYDEDGRVFISGDTSNEMSEDNGATWDVVGPSDGQTGAIGISETELFSLKMGGNTHMKRAPLTDVEDWTGRVTSTVFTHGSSSGAFQIQYDEENGRIYSANQWAGLWVYQFEGFDTGNTGTAAGAQPGLTAAASGTVGILSTAAGAQVGLIGAVTGATGIASTAAADQPGLTAAAEGAHGVGGLSAGAQPGLAVAASGTVGVIGEAAGAQPGLAGSATEDASIAGTLASELASLVAAASGTVGTGGTAAGSHAGDIGSATGTVGIFGSSSGVHTGLAAAASSGGVRSVLRPSVRFRHQRRAR